MSSDKPDCPQRRSPRLKDYDYSQQGAYFVTMYTQDRICLFGDVVAGTMRLNEAGQMVTEWWLKLSEKFPNIALDAFVLMPNHLHGIILVYDVETFTSLIEAVKWFKAMSTNAYIRGVRQTNWLPFPGKLWQRSFYDHIIRDDEALYKVCEYIENNPLQWHLDKNNPENFEP